MPLSPREPPWPGGTRDHQPLPTTEEPPSAAMTHLGLPKAPLSRQVGNAGTQHRPHKVSAHVLGYPQTLPEGCSGCSAPILPSPSCRSCALCHQRRTVASWARRPAECHPLCTPLSTGPPAPGMAQGPHCHWGGIGDMGCWLLWGIWGAEGEQGRDAGGVEMCRVAHGWRTSHGGCLMTHSVPRNPGSLGPSIPIPATLHPPWKREVTPLPTETTVMGTTGGTCRPPSTPSQSSSPQHWTRSRGSKAGHDHGGVGSE